MATKNENKETKEMEVVHPYAVLAGMEAVEEVMGGDFAGMDITLDRVKIPSGGMTAFEVPNYEDGADEETTMVKDIEGVIVHNHPAYSYYRNTFNGGSNPPDCGSFDGVMGVGTPGGNCANCPMNRYGTAGAGKACKNRRMLYILRQGELFPLQLSLPTGSLKEFSKYMKRLLTKGRKLNQVVTRISLKKATNANGIAYSQAVFTVVRGLSDAEKKSINVMTDQMKAYAANLSLKSMTAEEEPMVDYETGEIMVPFK